MATANESRTANAPERAENQKPPADTPPSEPISQQQQKAAQEALALPKGAILAMRKRNPSTTREVVVYPDGRVTYSIHDKPDNRMPRKLTDAQIANLRRMLDQIGFFRMASAASDATGDSFVYELGAHYGNRSHYVVCPTENLPGPLVPLIERLTELLPPETTTA